MTQSAPNHIATKRTSSETADNSSNSALENAFAQVRVHIDRIVEDNATRFFSEVADRSSPLVQAAMGAVLGGKRFRAICSTVGAAVAMATTYPSPKQSETSAIDLLLAAAAAPGQEQLAAALEFYQSSALVHDDVIDNSDERRGKPAAHIELRRSHAERALIGNAVRYGNDSAILCGDLLFAAADDAWARSVAGTAPDIASSVLLRYAKMIGEVAYGQFNDMSASYRPLSPIATEDAFDNAIAEAFSVIRLKSARYSVVHPSVLGAMRQGADGELTEVLEQILEPAGLAFQLRDDELGAFGSPQLTGKPTGIDIVEGKRTVLLAIAWKNADEESRSVLQQTFLADAPSKTQLQAAAKILRRFGHAEHEEAISKLIAESYDQLERADLPKIAKQLLRFLIDQLTVRDS